MGTEDTRSFAEIFSYLTNAEKLVVKSIILKKIEYKERLGIYRLHDSDTTDIVKDCGRKGIKIRRRDVEALGD